jgi:hypothetical protein
MLDAVADSLEARGLIKEAYEIDKIADSFELTNFHDIYEPFLPESYKVHSILRELENDTIKESNHKIWIRKAVPAHLKDQIKETLTGYGDVSSILAVVKSILKKIPYAESKWPRKEAYEIDKVADAIEATDGQNMILQVRKVLGIPESDTEFDRKIEDLMEAVRFKALDKTYHEEKVVKGIQLEVLWSDQYKEYVLYFPNVNVSEALEKGMHNTVIRLTDRKDLAKKVFDYAVTAASMYPDVYKLFHNLTGYVMMMRKSLEGKV